MWLWFAPVIFVTAACTKEPIRHATYSINPNVVPLDYNSIANVHLRSTIGCGAQCLRSDPCVGAIFTKGTRPSCHLLSTFLPGTTPSENNVFLTVDQGGSCIYPQGPFGGSGGKEFDERSLADTNGDITAVTIFFDTQMTGLQFEYGGIVAPLHGVNGSNHIRHVMDLGELVISVDLKNSEVSKYVIWMKLTTNHGAEVASVGVIGGIPARASGPKLLYVQGASGLRVDRIAFFFDYCSD